LKPDTVSEYVMCRPER